MSSKPTKTAGKSGQDVKQEDVIQAVVIADSFSTRFAPITETKPKALLPLVNRPMIDYTLEFLLLSGVQRAIVYCVSHADQIREYLKNSKWTRTVSPMTIQILSSPDCTSLGDALRDIDKMSLIRSEFILLTSFVVSNAQLIPILEKHKERKTTDKGLIMTHIFGQSFPGHQTSTPEEEFVMAVDPSTEQILHYQKTDSVNKLRFPLKLFKEKTSLDLRFDLMDTHISICSPTVLELFSDNFDYQTWDHFVKGILIDDEILGNNIYMHQLEGAYGAQVSNIHMYDAISKDIIRRWTFPLVPDMNRGPDTPRHTLSRHNVYQQPDVTLARGSVLEINVVVGQSSCIGESTHVTQSVIGRRCKIGNNVSISGSYVWNDVTVKDGCRIESALIADGVVLNENVEIYRGCVIGPGVSLAADTKVPPNTRLVAQPQELGDDDFGPSEGTDSEPTVAPLSVGSRAYVYQNDGQDESDAESLVDDPWGVDPAENDDEDETEDKDEYDDDEDEGADVGEEDDAEDGEDVDQRSDSSPLPEDARCNMIP